MALSDRHLNPELGRIVRTLGYDRQWVRGEGAHLIDSEGNRYLDLLSGYGVFAIGRNHPDAIAAVRETVIGAKEQEYSDCIRWEICD
jgi:ornithine--oxo-acid transaminase